MQRYETSATASAMRSGDDGYLARLLRRPTMSLSECNSLRFCGDSYLIASAKGLLPMSVAVLIQKGCDASLADKTGVNPIHWVAQAEISHPRDRKRWDETLVALLASSAKFTIDISTCDRNSTLLIDILLHASDRTFEAMMNRRPDTTLQTRFGFNALHILSACAKNRTSIKNHFDRLVCGGLDINAFTTPVNCSSLEKFPHLDPVLNKKLTALMIAIKFRNLEMCRYLIEAGAALDLGATPSRGHTALIYAMNGCSPAASLSPFLSVEDKIQKTFDAELFTRMCDILIDAYLVKNDFSFMELDIRQDKVASNQRELFDFLTSRPTVLNKIKKKLLTTLVKEIIHNDKHDGHLFSKAFHSHGQDALTLIVSYIVF